MANADRMMTTAGVSRAAIIVRFADDCRGSIPLTDLHEVDDYLQIEAVELPNPYQLTIRTVEGDQIEIPWDFARAYCDPTYEARVESVATRGRKSIGTRIRQMRIASGRTQEQVADVADLGRVTLARIESGRQSPKLQTLISLSKALGRPVQELLLDSADVQSTAPVARKDYEPRAKSAKNTRSMPSRSAVGRRKRTKILS